MRVLIYPSDRGPCGNYRLILPAKAVRQQHPDWYVEIADFNRFPRKELVNARVDLVVMQRPTPRDSTEIIRTLRRRGVAVIVDMDDDLSRVHHRHAAAKMIRQLHHNATAACAEATMVTTTTPALDATYGPGVVLPNYVPAHYLDQPHKDSAIIGWAGSITSHPADLDVMGNAMFRLAVQEKAEFFVAGDGAGVARAWGLRSEIRASGTVGLSDWPVVVSQIGIGVAPLENSLFNQGKSRLKTLEYSSLGVPWVASPTPDYVGLHKEGCGLLARTPDEWFRTLRRLARNPQLRWDLADAGREVACRNTIQANAWRFAEVWASAVEQERKSICSKS